MRKHFVAAIATLPLLLSPSNAAQRWAYESSQPYGIPSEDSGTSSYLGVDIVDITTDRLGALKLKEEQGVEVTMVDQDAPAGKAGIKEHDVILSMNGATVESKSQLQRMIHETPPGRVVTLGLSRDGQPLTLKVQLADRRNEFAHTGWKDRDMDKNFHVEIPPIPNLPDFDVPAMVAVHSSLRSSLMVENLTAQLGEFFGAKNGNGVLVRSVEKGSRAEKAGLRAGDVITRVGDQPVHDSSDFMRALRSRNGGSITMGVLRDRKEQTLTLTLPERRESGDNLDEESLDEPDVNAEVEIDLSEVQDEIARLRPEIKLASQQAVKAAAEAQKAYCKEQIEQMKRLQQEIAPRVQQELEKSREKLQQEMEKLQIELQDSFEL